METGKVTLSRKRNYSDSSRRGSDDFQNRRYADHGHGVKQRDGFHVPSRRGGWVADEGRISARRGKEYQTSAASREKQELQNGEGLAQEKKRKFSPIIWDEKEDVVKRSNSKELEKISLNRKVSPASVIVSPGKSGSESLSEGSPYRSPRLLNHSHAETKEHQLKCQSQIKPLFHDLDLINKAPVLLNDTVETGNLEHGLLEDGEFVQERVISKSRWASEVDSPTEMCMPDGGIELDDMDIENGEIRMRQLGRRAGSSDELDGYEKAGSGLEDDGDTDLLVSYDNGANVNSQLIDMDCPSDTDISEVEEPLSLGQRGIVMLNCCRDVFEYEKLNKINEGTYGIVFRAKDKKTGDIVALKKVKMNQGDSDGFPLSALREINILLSLNHPSIVNVKEVVMGGFDDSVYMVMEYMEHDLKGLMERRKRPFSTSEIKCLMVQLLEGVKYLHDNWVIHRDLKTSNLLMNNKGELKICDLGMSRQYGSELKPYTPLVVTLWYRAPELLLGTKQYSTAIDMWSIGCIMAEWLANEPLFNGNTEIKQIDKIFRMLGTPTEDIWPDFTNLPGAKANFVKQPYNLLRKKFPVSSFTGSSVLSASGFDLLNRLLTYDPKKRITADEALKHAWFQEVPFATSKDLMPTFPPPHVVNR